MNFQCNLPQNISFKPDCLSSIGNSVKPFGTRVFAAIDPYLQALGMGDEIKQNLKKENIDCVLYSKIKPNPNFHDIDTGARICSEENCDVILGIGGGSAIDSGKAIAIVARNEGSSWDYIARSDRETRTPDQVLPIIAIPTTAGTGTEATPYSVISNPDIKEKGCIHNPKLIPVLALISPELMSTVPPRLTANTGIDALSHSLESYINVNSNIFSDFVARESISLIFRYLPEAVANGDNINAREQMAWASTLGGIAIAHAGTTLPHGMGQPVSGLVDMPHGASIAACIIPILEESFSSNLEKFALLAETMDSSVSDLPLRKKAEKTVELTERLLKDIGSRVRFGDYGMTESDIEKAAEICINNYSFDINNHPRKVDKNDIINLYKRCL